MSNNKPNIKTIVDSIAPDHLVANYPRLIEFVKAYFDFLETSNKSAYYQNTLLDQRSVHYQESQFLAQIQKELGIFVPKVYASDAKIFYDKISELWKSKGSEEAIKTFFQLFLDDVVEITYPWNSALIPSDGRWIKDSILRITMKEYAPGLTRNALDFVGKTIKQVTSDARAVVDSVEVRNYSDGPIYELKLIPSTISNKFDPQEDVVALGDPQLIGEIYKSVSALKIINAGTGYTIGDRITVTGFNGFTFVAYVATVSPTGAIQSVQITNFGSGNTPRYVRRTNVSNLYFIQDFIVYQYSDVVPENVPSPVININTANGANAVLTLQYGSVVSYAGRYNGVHGQLSESIVLQDSYYYQKYSYQVNTRFSTSEWINQLTRTIHPAGRKVFGNISIFNVLNSKLKSAEIYVIKAEPSAAFANETLSIGTNVMGTTQSYSEALGVYFAEDYVGEIKFNTTETVGTNASTSSVTVRIS
jgi:hypothetical protein